jgi:hypothetical protein
MEAGILQKRGFISPHIDGNISGHMFFPPSHVSRAVSGYRKCGFENPFHPGLYDHEMMIASGISDMEIGDRMR